MVFFSQEKKIWTKIPCGFYFFKKKRKLTVEVMFWKLGSKHFLSKHFLSKLFLSKHLQTHYTRGAKTVKETTGVEMAAEIAAEMAEGQEEVRVFCFLFCFIAYTLSFLFCISSSKLCSCIYVYEWLNIKLKRKCWSISGFFKTNSRKLFDWILRETVGYYE